MDKIKSHKARIAAALVFCCVMGAIVWFFKWHWEDEHLFTFAKDIFPFIVSIALAFIPDHKMNMHTRVMWRSAVILTGLGFSVLLWHQESLSEAALQRQEKTYLTEAVTKANQHTDERLNGVSIHTDSQIDSVKKDLAQTAEEMSRRIDRTAVDITERVGKVTGIPLTPPKIKFSFMVKTMEELPILTRRTSLVDGKATVDFTVVNVSDTSAVKVEMWVRICNGCKFAEEPKGFQKLSGAQEQDRYRVVEVLNPNVFLEDMKMVIIPPLAAPAFQISWFYDCPTCSHKKDFQNFMVYLQ